MPEIDADRDRSGGRNTVLAVTVAVIFLAVLGSSVGFILGSDRRDGPGDPLGGQTALPTSTPTATSGSGGSTPPDGPTGGTTTRTRTQTATRSYGPPKRDACPQQTAEAVGAGSSDALNLVLYVRTARSEAWICQYQGRTFYQGHLRGRSFPAATSDTSILVNNVRYEAGVHAATNGTTVYYVSPERLRIETDGKETFNETVEDYYGGG